jgi:hypothetical protein
MSGFISSGRGPNLKGDVKGQQRTIQPLSNALKISVEFNPELPSGRADVL